MCDQSDVSRKDFWLKHISDCRLYKQIAALTKRQDDFEARCKAEAEATRAAIAEEYSKKAVEMAAKCAADFGGAMAINMEKVLECLKEFKPELDANNGREGKLGVKPEYLTAVRAGLTAVVNEPGGTAYRSRLPDIRFAGKTGTAQVVKLGQKQNLKTDAQQYFSRDHAWFASFAPAEDPEIVVIVLNEHGGWGAEAAAPVASKIIKAWSDIKKQDETKSMARAEQ